MNKKKEERDAHTHYFYETLNNILKHRTYTKNKFKDIKYIKM